MIKKHLFSVLTVGTIWLGLSIWGWFLPAKASTTSERRKLQQMPQLSVSTLLSGDFMSEFETYTQDQFPQRDGFRTLKAITQLYGLMRMDNNGIYLSRGYAAKMLYPLNEASVERAGERLTAIYERYFAETNAAVYLAVVPDKGYFLAEESGHLSLDFDRLATILQKEMSWAEYVDITETLKLSSYYRTDTHWDQMALTGTAGYLAAQMGADVESTYETVTLDVPFYGVYYGQSALPLSPDKLTYLTNAVLEGCSVYHFETGEITGIYTLEKQDGNDPYDIFLSGANPLLTIENPAQENGRELVVFRDSFGSSLVPLLVEGYSKITVIDTRYIRPELIGNFVTFSGEEDVLFLYSTLLLNDSGALR